eukprot:TRINITY_DN6424_c1_g2_i2.p1 TRINITY_DN6424_c1_g2~~TRINITY_DN6424_c1_g2_i2.p1  ORF type:complete len:270 (-),score=94.97 TRINITY_DN6424_c1_g2_i2:283-1092(-)
MSQRVILVTGSNKGIGKAIVRALAKENNVQVILTSRSMENGENALNDLESEGLSSIVLHQLDITDEQSILNIKSYVEEQYGGLDVLINNAGIAFKGNAFDENVAKTTIDTNYFATLNMTNQFLPVMKENSRIVNVSSMTSNLSKVSEALRDRFNDPNNTIESVTNLMNEFIGHVKNNTYSENGWPKQTYAVSKMGVTAVTKVLARENPNIQINCCCPGWVRTDMAGDKAPKSPDEGAITPVWLAISDEINFTGQFCQDKTIANESIGFD